MFSSFIRLLGLTLLLTDAISLANATIIISPDASKNITCSGGICSSFRASAVLNIAELQDLLASGDVAITTSGSPPKNADIRLQTPLTWSNASTLTLDSYHSIVIGKAVSVTGLGGLTIVTNDGGSGGGLSFKSTGHVTFSNLSSALTINGIAYTLAGSIAALKADIQSNAAGHYALASSYDAIGDGVYSQPQLIGFNGTLEGLGNAISNLTIINLKAPIYAALFDVIQANGVVENLKMTNVLLKNWGEGRSGGLTAVNQGLLSGISVSGEIISTGSGTWVGGIAAFNALQTSIIVNSHSSVHIHGDNTAAGGLVALNNGLIRFSHSAGSLSGGLSGGGLVWTNGRTIDSCYSTVTLSHIAPAVIDAPLGGLAAINSDGIIVNSYAKGNVSGRNGSAVGGLVGTNAGTIVNSYAIGNATGGKRAIVGGLVGATAIHISGYNFPISNSYSTGQVVAGSGSMVGAFIGRALDSTMTNDYWDTITSGISDTSQGAGDVNNEPGITGLTTTQLQSGLPAGFDPSIWAVDPAINDGYPYLLANIP